MAINPRPKKKLDDAAIDAFIDGAPDAKSGKERGLEVMPVLAPEPKKRKGLIKGSRIQFSHTMTPELVDRVDVFIRRRDMTRAGLINMAVSRYLEEEGG